MGVLDKTCSDLFFPMKCDIYYATETQDKYGKMNKNWTIGNTLDCSLYALQTEKNKDFVFENQRFFKLDGFLVGRTKKDPRMSNSGLYYPMSNILVTNIRGKECSDELFFFESTDDYEKKATIYELRSCQAYVGPYTTIEHFSLTLERSDTQEFE
jgi:hypothetical protein